MVAMVKNQRLYATKEVESAVRHSYNQKGRNCCEKSSQRGPVELPLEQWVEVLRFLRLSEMMYTCTQFRGSSMKYKAAREVLAVLY